MVARQFGLTTVRIDLAPAYDALIGALQPVMADPGISYADLDRYLVEGPPGAAPALAMRIERLARASDHKRELPPIPDFD